MIQDIAPKVFHNEYRDFEPDEESLVISFAEDKVLVRQKNGETFLPRYNELALSGSEYYYLFSIEGEKYFLASIERDENDSLLLTEESKFILSQTEKDKINKSALSQNQKDEDCNIQMTGEKTAAESGYEYLPVGTFREMKPRHTAFATVTAYQIYRWYRDNRFCGRCGQRMIPDERERMLRCPDCGNLVYPRISPAVIVGLVDGDRILMTRYAGREYQRYALVAGFAEIGETLEQTVVREVMEEVGLRVKNIRYYKSQPWSFSDSLLSGFFAELDGAANILLDEEELAEATWFRRGEIPVQDDGISLTREMIQAFADNRWQDGPGVKRELLFFMPVEKKLVWGSESWTVSAHEHGDCQVKEGSFAGKTLSQLWQQRPDLFGISGEKSFPLLVKIIDAKEDLSIQVHPDDEYAGQNENGSRGKTECWYILECAAGAGLVLGHKAADKVQLAERMAAGAWAELLQEVSVQPGDFIQIEPGTVHAIKGGIKLLEIQQSSDITYRLYDYDRIAQGKPRALHLSQGLAVITAPDTALTERHRPAGLRTANIYHELIRCNYYTVGELQIEESVTIPAHDSFYIICVIAGNGLIDGRSVKTGDHFIVPVGYGEAVLRGEMKLILVTTECYL